MKESAIVYRNFMRAVKKLPVEKQGEAYEAYLLYAMDGEEYSGDDCSISVLLECFREQVEKDREKYQAQCERARATASKRSRNDLDTKSDEIVTKSNEVVTTSYEVVTDNDIDNDNVIDIKKKNTPNGVQKENVIDLPLNTGEYPVQEDQVEEWEKLYPAVDVRQELRNMRGWLMANPTRRKTKTGINRFVVGWLAREQDKGKVKEKPKNHFSGERADDLNNEVLEEALKFLGS